MNVEYFWDLLDRTIHGSAALSMQRVFPFLYVSHARLVDQVFHILRVVQRACGNEFES